jgi:uncharacterized protein
VQRYVVFYESAADVMSKAPPVYPRHLARLKEFRDRGDLLLVGTFGDPQAEGSMAVFGSREAAEEFVRDDPVRQRGRGQGLDAAGVGRGRERDLSGSIVIRVGLLGWSDRVRNSKRP